MDIDYKNGPVYERAICIYTCIPEDQFLEGLEVWKGIVESELPVYTRFANHEFTFTGDANRPPVRQVSIRHRFWSTDPKQKHANWCVQLSPDRFIVNLRREGPEDKKGFAEIQDFFDLWYPKWRTCFGNPASKRVNLEYWNRINKDTVPGHANENYVEVRDIIAVFAATPMPRSAAKYVVPYQYQANWEVANEAEEKSYRLSADISAQYYKPMTLQAHFMAGIGVEGNECPGGELSQLHNYVLEVFDAFFTSEAKALFK